MAEKASLNFASMEDNSPSVDQRRAERRKYATDERKMYAQYAYTQNPAFMEQKTQGSNFYFPGKTPGQPYKYDQFKQCYTFVVH